MSTGPEHYQEAERLLHETESVIRDCVASGDVPPRQSTEAGFAAAQVHATLALAAATVISEQTRPDSSVRSFEAWKEAIA